MTAAEIRARFDAIPADASIATDTIWVADNDGTDPEEWIRLRVSDRPFMALPRLDFLRAFELQLVHLQGHDEDDDE